MAFKDTVFEIKPVKVYVPTSSIPAVKQAARELDIDFTDGEFDGEYKAVYFLICDYASLLSIGFLAGVNSLHNPTASLIKELVDKL